MRDVVVVDLYRLMPVGRAPGGVEERDVVRVLELLRRCAGELPETDGEHGAAERMLERLAGAEVGGERERADHLGDADRLLGPGRRYRDRPVTLCRHAGDPRALSLSDFAESVRGLGVGRHAPPRSLPQQMAAGVDLYWLPLGAGGHSVRLNGKVFEALVAGVERRPRNDLYHSALVVCVPEGRFVIEQGPAGRDGTACGVVAVGAVGSRYTRRFRIFRYEVRCWREGVIPDLDEAVESPRRLTSDEDTARHLLGLVPDVPTPVWGRDELGAGEMWNSNSVISWLVTRSDLDADEILPPAGGRAPGWRAGVAVARRHVRRSAA